MAQYNVQGTFQDGISPALTKLQGNVQQLSNSFNRLQGVIAALAFGAAIRNAVAFADAIQDINDATGIAIENIIGFSQAVTLNGGSAEKANMSLLRLTQTIGTAANGSSEALKAFQAVGVTLDDIMTRSEQDILGMTVEGLARMTDASQRATVQQQLFGKTLMGVNVRGVAAGYAAATAEAGKYAQSVRQAAELQNQLDIAFGKLREGVLRALEPMIKFVNALSPEQIERIVKAIVDISVALGSLSVAVRVFGAIGAAATAVAGYFALAKTGVTSLKTTIDILTKQVGYFQKAWAAASGVMGKFGEIATFVFTLFTKRLPWLLGGLARLVPLVAAVTTAFWALNEVVKLITGTDVFKTLGEWAGKAWDFITGKTREATGANDANNESLAETKRLAEAASGAHAKAAQEQIDRGNEIRRILQEQAAELGNVVEGYRRAAEEAQTRYQAETDLIRATEQQRLQYEGLSQAQGKFFQEYFKLYAEYEKLAGSQSELEQKKAAQIATALQELTKIYGEEAAAVLANTAARARANEARAFEQYTIQQSAKDFEELTKVQDELRRGPMTAIERKYYDIEDAAKASARAAIQAEEARRGAKLDETEARRYYETARVGAEKLIAVNKRLTEQQRSFAYGWKQAFKEYVDNATNAAQQAQRMFDKFTQGLEDMIVNFAKTGKFEWKSFVASMAEELLRSQIKQTLASIMQVANPFGGGSIGDALGGLFGGLTGGQRGQSPTQPLYVSDVSGGLGGGGGGIFGGGSQQGGGSIFDTIGNAVGGVWNGVKNIAGGLGNTVSNVVKTVSNVGGGLWDGIKNIGSSIVSGIGSLFGGFFANGGMLPAGKFGIVGERGPELISGPAGITPLASMGGSTNVYYTINAVDAPSFQSLLAQDPSFIFALTEQGRKSFAGAR